MKKVFIILSICFALGGLASGNYEVTAVASVGLFAFSHEWKETTKTNVLASVALYPAQVKDAGGAVVPMWTRAQRYLAGWLADNGNEVTIAALRANKITWNPVTYFIRYDITGLFGRQEIFGAQTTKVVGISNLDKAKLPQYYNFCYDKIAVRYATVALPAASPASVAGYSSVRGSMPPGLANGDLIVSLNDSKQIDTSVSDFTTMAAITAGSSRELDGGELQVPKVWVEGIQIKAELNIPVVIPSTVNNTYFVEVAFYGVEARLS